jgi:hypothetical protein
MARSPYVLSIRKVCAQAEGTNTLMMLSGVFQKEGGRVTVLRKSEVISLLLTADLA